MAAFFCAISDWDPSVRQLWYVRRVFMFTVACFVILEKYGWLRQNKD